MKKFAALAIAAAMGLACVLTACSPNSGGGPNVSDKPDQTVTKPPEKPTPIEAPPVTYTSSDYVKKYADNSAMEKWLSDNVSKSSAPPVDFNIDNNPAAAFDWVKTEGETRREIYFESEGIPSERVFKTVEYFCELARLKVVVEFSSYTDYPIIEYDATVYNINDGNSPRLSELSSVNAAIAAGDGESEYYVHTNRGSTSSHFDFEPLSYKLNGTRRIEVKSGKSTSDYVPFFNIENRTAHDGTIAILNWQGNWRAEFKRTSGGVALDAGLWNTDVVLREGENMRFPGTALLFYKGNRMNGQNVYRRWLYNCNLFRYQNKHMQSTNVLIGSEDTSEKGDLAGIQRYVDFGINDLIDKFNIDAGWYPMDWDWWHDTGDWYADPERYPNGLDPVREAAHQAGMQLAVWFEPERIMRDSAAAEALGDRLITLDGNRDLATKDTAHFWDAGSSLVDYSDPTAVRYITNLLNSKIDQYGIDQYRQDFNTDPAIYWLAKDRADAQKLGIARDGYTENHYCTGYLDVYAGLLAEHPDLYIDACAAGGRRNDLETMRYSFMHTRSDNWGDVESAQLQTYGSSMWFMYWGTGFSSGDLNDYDVRSHIGNSIGVGVSEREKAYRLADALTDWKHFSEYLFYDYYPLTPYAGSSRETMCLQYDSPENGKGMMISYFRKNDTVSPRLVNLDPTAEYEIWDYDNPTYRRYKLTGAQLMQGFTVSSLGGTARVFEYKLADGSSNEAFQKAEYDPSVENEYNSSMKLEDVGVPTAVAEYVDVMTDEYLSAHYTSPGVGNASFVCADKYTSGTIYAVNKNVYDEVVTTGATVDGWRVIDKGAFSIGSASGGFYPLGTWADSRFCNLQPLIKKIGDAYFLWMYGFTVFADPDGDWHNDGSRAFGYTKNTGGSASIAVSINIENQERIKLDGVSDDGRDKTYKIDAQIYSSLVYTGKGFKEGEVTLYQVNANKIGFAADYNKVPPVGSDYSSNTVMLGDLDLSGGVFAYVKDGEYYLRIVAAAEIMLPANCAANVPRALFIWIDGNGVRREISFVYP